MKKALMVVLFLFPVLAHAQEEDGEYPWILTMFGGGAAFVMNRVVSVQQDTHLAHLSDVQWEAHGVLNWKERMPEQMKHCLPA